MARFSVEASAANGRTRERLSIEARSPTEAARQVLAQGRFPITVKAERIGLAARLDRSVWGGDRIGLAELALFAEQLADLVRAGVTIEQALDLLATGDKASSSRSEGEGDRRDRTIGRLAQRLLRRIREGAAFSAALREEPAVPRAFAGVIQGAEGAGALAAGQGANSQR